MNRLKCSTCGASAEGREQELFRKGWRVVSRKKNNRVKRSVACPLHAELLDGEAR